MFLDSTICAVASPAGEGAIAIIRVSGHNAFTITNKIFRHPKNIKLCEVDSQKMIFGQIIDNNNQIIDEVLITIFKKPNSYTGEDVVEIFCHGAVFIQKKILELLIKNGAEHAREGEFTLRAFLNGKIDLPQAEAINDLIQSKTKLANTIAINQLKGKFSKQIADIRKKLIDFVALIELELDFAEEDVEFANRSDLFKTVNDILSFIDNLIHSFTLGNVIKKGIATAIVGKPNVGKSTLLNLLLNEEKAIVSEIPGTTRDIVEDTINIGGVSFRFMDTAGIRDTTDSIESKGIERTFLSVKKAGLVLLILDAEDSVSEMKKMINTLIEKLNTDTKLLVVINKVDKLLQQQLNKKKDTLSKLPHDIIYVSAKDPRYLQVIEQKLLDITGIRNFTEEQVLITNIRHYQALLLIKEALTAVKKGMKENIPEDLLTLNIRQALHHIGEISGEIAPDDILNNIFKNFCIGK